MLWLPASTQSIQPTHVWLVNDGGCSGPAGLPSASLRRSAARSFPSGTCPNPQQTPPARRLRQPAAPVSAEQAQGRGRSVAVPAKPLWPVARDVPECRVQSVRTSEMRPPSAQCISEFQPRRSLPTGMRGTACTGGISRQYEGGRDGMRSASSRGAPAAGRWRRSRARAWSGGRSPPRARPPSSRAGAAWAVPTPAGCPVSSQLRRVFRKSWLPIDRPQRAQVPPVVGRPVPFLYPMVASFLSSIVVVKVG